MCRGAAVKEGRAVKGPWSADDKMAKGTISVATVVVVVVVLEDEDEVPEDSKMMLPASGLEDGMEDDVGDDPKLNCSAEDEELIADPKTRLLGAGRDEQKGEGDEGGDP